jgi:hypothetical protein
VDVSFVGRNAAGNSRGGSRSRAAVENVRPFHNAPKLVGGCLIGFTVYDKAKAYDYSNSAEEAQRFSSVGMSFAALAMCSFTSPCTARLVRRMKALPPICGNC